MKISCTNIEWDISDENVIQEFGSLRDDNDIPYTAKDFGLPAWDREVIVTISDNDWNSTDESDRTDLVCEELEAMYTWAVKGLHWEVKND